MDLSVKECLMSSHNISCLIGDLFGTIRLFFLSSQAFLELFDPLLGCLLIDRLTDVDGVDRVSSFTDLHVEKEIVCFQFELRQWISLGITT